MERREKIFPFVLFVLVALIVDLLIYVMVEVGEGSWYATLKMPSWTITDGSIGLIWTVVFILIGLSGGLIWLHREKSTAGWALGFWIVQLILLALWPLSFFWSEAPVMGAIELTLLFVAVFVLIFYAFRTHFLAGLFLVPYFLWLIYVVILGWSIVSLNPALDEKSPVSFLVTGPTSRTVSSI
jgi:translocator protein